MPIAAKKSVDNFPIINTHEMKQARLENLKGFLATEQMSAKPAKRYMDDLKFSIKSLEEQIQYDNDKRILYGIDKLT